MKKAMVTIEVLVSMLILFLVIASSFNAIKFFNIVNKQKVSYEEEYIAVLNIKDKISSNICKSSKEVEGTLNGFKYNASCLLLKELKTYKKSFDIQDVSGNYGSDKAKVYSVSLRLKKNNYEKEHNYLIFNSVKVR